MKDQHIANLQRLAGSADTYAKRQESRGVGQSSGACRARQDRAALLWAITTITANEDMLAQEAKSADELVRLLGFDPKTCRTDGGFLNVGKIRAAWRHKVASMRVDAALLISSSRQRLPAGRSVSAMLANRLAPFPDPVPPAATGRSATRHPLAAEADRLASLDG